MLAFAFVLQAALFLLITLRWKISLHSAAASNLAVIGWLTVGLNGLALALIIPVVAWARVHLRRHTLAQTVGGALLGVVVVMTAIWLTSVG
jgi:membrane-associated phospholipid phosphatase